MKRNSFVAGFKRGCLALLVLALFQGPVRDAQAAVCPSKDFPTFLAAYMNSIDVQKAFTLEPLQKLTTVDAEPEPKQVRHLLGSRELEFPLIPDAKTIDMRGLILQITDRDQFSAAVKLQKPDTGYQVIYRFSFDTCWVLNEIQDDSI